jgi:hypothetical protein
LHRSQFVQLMDRGTFTRTAEANHRGTVLGFIYQVETGRLREVSTA